MAIKRYGLKDFSQLIAQQIDDMTGAERSTLKSKLRTLTPKQVLQLKSKIVTAAAIKAMGGKATHSDVVMHYYHKKIARGAAYSEAAADAAHAKAAMQAQRPQVRPGAASAAKRTRADTMKYFSKLNRLEKTAASIEQQYQADPWGDVTGVTGGTAAGKVLANLEKQGNAMKKLKSGAPHARPTPFSSKRARADMTGFFNKLGKVHAALQTLQSTNTSNGTAAAAVGVTYNPLDTESWLAAQPSFDTEAWIEAQARNPKH